MSGAHHPFGPSRLSMREACPASYRMELGVEDTTSEAAAEGSLLHSIMAKTLQKQPCAEMDSLTDEQRELIQACLDAVGEASDVWVEIILMLDGTRKPSITYGTADLVIDHGNGRGTVIDWKFGRGDVPEASRNLQLAAYAVMAADRYGFNEVEAMIVQPRLRKVTRHTYRDFDSIRGYIETVIEKAERPDAPANPSEANCRYCRGLGHCPAVQKTALAAVEETRMDISMLTHSQLSEMAEKLCLAEKFWHQVAKPEIKRRIEIGDSVPGWEVKPGAKRKEADASELYGVIRETLDPAEFTACCKVSIPKVKAEWTRIKSNRTGCTKKDAGAMFDALTESAIKVTRGESRLVRSGESEAEEAA